MLFKIDIELYSKLFDYTMVLVNSVHLILVYHYSYT